MSLNVDQPHRLFRFIELLYENEGKQSKNFWTVVEGWLVLAEARCPGTPKALVEGDYVIRLPDGAAFKEVSFKSEHQCVEQALSDWAAAANRRWARYQHGSLHISDGKAFPLSALELTKV